MREQDRPLVLHHADNDGFAAAWAIYHFFKPKGVTIDARPVQYGEEPPCVQGRRVYVVDFSYPRETLEQLYSDAKRLRVFDHHKTAEENLRGLKYCKFSSEDSGGLMVWKHFHKDKQAPLLIRYADDHDLWTFNLPYSKAIMALLQTTNNNFDAWDDLESRMHLEFDRCVAEGSAIRSFQGKMIHILTMNTRMTKIGDHRVPCVNTNVPYLTSDLVGKLAARQPFGAAWFQQPDGKFNYSLRSDEHGIDVSEIAVQYGGGGHKHAAGFTVSEIL